MKEKNTFPSKRKSIFYLILCLIATLFVSSFIYFLVLHPSLDNKIVRDIDQHWMDLLLSVCL